MSHAGPPTMASSVLAETASSKNKNVLAKANRKQAWPREDAGKGFAGCESSVTLSWLRPWPLAAGEPGVSALVSDSTDLTRSYGTYIGGVVVVTLVPPGSSTPNAAVNQRRNDDPQAAATCHMCPLRASGRPRARRDPDLLGRDAGRKQHRGRSSPIGATRAA